jgi:hypothetical protein
MESHMLYKTIVLKMLEERPRLYQRLRRSRTLMQTLDRYSAELNASCEAWKESLSRSRPDSSQEQIASEALEMALRDLVDSLPPESPPDDSDPLSLDAAMAFLRRHTPPT